MLRSGFFVHPCTRTTSFILSCCQSAKKSKYFVQMWVERYRDTKTVDDLTGKGETWATSSKEDKMIVTLFKRNPTLRLREAKAKLADKGQHVSINTIRRTLAEAKVQYRPTRQKPLLSEIHIGKTLDMGYGKCRSRLVQCTFFGQSVLLGMGTLKTCMVSQ